MNKYIRTEKGIFEVDEWFDSGSCWCMYNGGKYVSHFEIINQANTIEELCDEFVCIEYKKPRVLDKVITREIKEKGIKIAETIYCHPNWNGIIYGAIWTDRGLIYVAKVNKKGELFDELI